MSEESEKTAGILAKIKAKQWKAMGRAVEQMRQFTDEAGMGDFVSDLKETLSLQVADALAPLKNEINEALMDALEPILPEVVILLTAITDKFALGLGAIKAALTGDLDNWLKEETLKFQKGMDSWSDGLKEMHTQVQKFWYMVEKGQLGEALVLGWEGFARDVGGAWAGFWNSLRWE